MHLSNQFWDGNLILTLLEWNAFGFSINIFPAIIANSVIKFRGHKMQMMSAQYNVCDWLR